MYVALLLKVDVSNEHASSQKVLGSLVVDHVCFFLVVVVEAAMVACGSFREGRVVPRV